MESKKPVTRYSTAFKMRVVDDVENCLLSTEEARKLYGIGGHRTINDWIVQYGKNSKMGKKVYIMTKDEELEIIALRREVKLLRKALENAQIKEITLESLIEVAEEEYHIDVKKNLNSRLLDEARKKLSKSVSDPI